MARRPSLAQRELERARNHQALREYLTVDEEIRLAARQHWIVLVAPIAWAVVVTAGSLWLFLHLPARLSANAPTVLAVICAAIWLRAAWKVLVRHHDLFVATDKRVLKYQGILVTDVPMMRLTKVTDMRYTKSIWGELLGYGTIIIESAGQDQAIRDVTYLPDPLENYRRLCEVIFGDKHRPGHKREKAWRRALERVARRGRGGAATLDDGDDDWDEPSPAPALTPTVPTHRPAPSAPPSSGMPGAGTPDPATGSAPAPTPPASRGPVTLYESEDRKARRRSADTQTIWTHPTDDPGHR